MEGGAVVGAPGADEETVGFESEHAAQRIAERAPRSTEDTTMRW
jgi:hypothetical protein